VYRAELHVGSLPGPVFDVTKVPSMRQDTSVRRISPAAIEAHAGERPMLDERRDARQRAQRIVGRKEERSERRQR
jgi:hypothetical protein